MLTATNATITEREFSQFQGFIFDAAGISLQANKTALVSGRLAQRLAQHKLDSFGAYFRLLKSGHAPDEVQTAVDLLTTNETYFFREPRHFEFLREQALAWREPGALRVWSAACSSGEEPYSMAMVLASCLPGQRWEVLGSDISTRVLQRARSGHYPDQRARMVPPAHLQRYCLKGAGEQEGTMLVARELRERVRFEQINLNQALPQVGQFDIIFLRNVMIYFSDATKRDVVNRLLAQLKPGGHFCIGHAETLNQLGTTLEQVAPAIYRKRARGAAS